MHAAAGPLNHWFYLLSQGSNASPASPTCNGSTVTGLGIQTAGQDLLQRPAAEDLELDPRRRPQGDAPGRGQPVRHHQLHQLQHRQGGLGRGLRPGPVGRGHLRRRHAAGGSCTEVTATGSATSGFSTYKPSSSGFTAAAGTIKGCLTGPSGVDLDLYLQRRNTSGSWVDVAASESATSTETITYSATAGTYRWDVYAYSGSGSFTLKYDVP